MHLRFRLTLGYIILATALILISGAGHLRLLSEVGHTFGGFFWAIDTNGQVVVVSTPPQLPPFGAFASSINNNDTIAAVNGQKAASNISLVYQHARPGDSITYLIQHNATTFTVKRAAATFTMDMWWSNYGLALLAGLSWILVGMVLLATAQEWTGAVEGITLIPPAMLFLLYSHWGNVQQAYPADIVFQLVWVPSFALLGAAFIHLSLTYRPHAWHIARRPRLMTDGLPYLPLLALGAYEWSSYFIFGAVPTRPNLVLSLGYGVFGGVISFAIGITSLLRVAGFNRGNQIPANIRRRLGDLLTLWIGGVGLGFCLGILPILLTGQTLLPLSMFYLLAMVYPVLLLYAIRSLRLIDRLQITLEEREAALTQREAALLEQQKTGKSCASRTGSFNRRPRFCCMLMHTYALFYRSAFMTNPGSKRYVFALCSVIGSIN